jgi:putative membrane protein
MPGQRFCRLTRLSEDEPGDGGYGHLREEISMAMKRILTGVALGVAVCAGSAMAQNGGMNGGGAQQQQQQPGGAQQNGMNQPGGMNGMATTGGQASMQDKMFLRQASAGDQFEIQTSQLALQKSSSDDVKQFAQMMIDDHTKLDNQMKPIAQEAGVQPATGLMGKDKKEYAKLQGLSGPAFDQAYIKDMVMGHQKVDKAFASEVSDGTLPSEKQAAATNKPTVDMHLQKAQALAQAHNVTMSGM